MPSTKNFNILREQLLARSGAAELLVEIRKETLAEIGLCEFEQGPAAEPAAESNPG